jgi:hypothetical protein
LADEAEAGGPVAAWALQRGRLNDQWSAIMKPFKTGLFGAAVLAAGLLAAGASQASQLFNFSYSGAGVSGGGVLTTSDVGSPYAVTGITGTANGEAITGLSGYAGAENTVSYPTEPFLTFGGLSFSTASTDWNIGWTGSAYGIVNSLTNPTGECCGVSPIEFSISQSSAPEPAAWALMLLGFGAMGATLRRNRRPAPVLA